MQPFEALESMEKVESGCAQLLPSRGTMEFEARLALVLWLKPGQERHHLDYHSNRKERVSISQI